MKKIVKDFDKPPAILLNASRINKVRIAIASQSARHIVSDDYIPKPVRQALERLYHGKFSYCESTVKQVAVVQGEHYRPKNGVKKDSSHKGYYWLALEWSNLVLGCLPMSSLCSYTRRLTNPICI